MPERNTTQSSRRFWTTAIALVVAASAAASAWLSRETWLPYIREAKARWSNVNAMQASSNPQATAGQTATTSPVAEIVKISPQARANLGLTTAPLRIQDFWKKIATTGIIVDRPGFTDQGVTAPVDCFVAKIYAYEGDIVRPGDRLFQLRLSSQYLQATQSDFFKALRETEIIESEISRLTGLADRGVIPEKQVIELNQNLKRQRVEMQAHRQDLLARGLDENQLQQIAQGEFIKSIDIVVPPDNGEKLFLESSSATRKTDSEGGPLLELQELKVGLGEKAQAGQILCVLADHNHLYINGHGFKRETANIAHAAEVGWDVNVEFIENETGHWPKLEQPLKIRHLSNSVDLESRTFDFYIPLTNQSRSYTQDGRSFVIWRFRPGQRVRIQIPVEKIEQVFVVPAAAVISEGPETYVFQQNGDWFNRIPVHVLYRDRDHVVLANDGTMRHGFYVAQNSAAALNRILKSQSASGDNMAGFHVHADGSVHANH